MFGPTPNELSLNSIVVGSNGVAFTVGYGLVYSSPAPFTSWSDVSPQSLSETIFYGVSSFYGVRTLIVGAAGCIAVTTDSGQSWTQVNSNTAEDIYSISQGSDLEAMVIGSNNFAAKTTNGGLSWTTMTIFTTGSTTSQATYPPHTIYMLTTRIAFAASYSGEIYRTINGGHNWVSVTDAAVESTLYSLSFYSTNIGLAGDNLGHAFMLTPAPTAYPTSQPSTEPTSVPYLQPSVKPSCQPFCHP